VLFTPASSTPPASVAGPRGGVMVTQNGVPFLQPGELISSVGHFRKLFADAGCYVASIPTYVGGHMANGVGRRRSAIARHAGGNHRRALPAPPVRSRPGTGHRRCTRPRSRCRDSSPKRWRRQRAERAGGAPAPRTFREAGRRNANRRFIPIHALPTITGCDGVAGRLMRSPQGRLTHR